MNLSAFFVENCFFDNEYVKYGVIFSKYFFKSHDNGFKAVFPIFSDEKFYALNSFILRLIKEYSIYAQKTGCKKVILTFTFKNDSFISLLLEIFYKSGKIIRGINYDLTTMLPLTTNSFFKLIKIKKKQLNKIAESQEENVILLYDSSHIYCGKLRLFGIKKSSKQFAEFKISI